jgi:Na+-driven multidrug efflux pump
LYSLIVTIARTLLIVIPVAALLGIAFGMGMNGVYLGFLIAGWTASLFAFVWSQAFIRKLRRHPGLSPMAAKTEVAAEE